MNVYDFDETIYDGDSSVDYTLFCLRKRPALALRLLGAAGPALAYRLGRMSKTAMKEHIFSYLRDLPATPELLDEFWDGHINKVKAFYTAQRRPDDLVISASPEFLLRPACARLGIQPPIASRVDAASGRFEGLNCHDVEKVRRLREQQPGAQVENFYSDSRSDSPLAEIADAAWLVKGEDIRPW